MSGNPEEKDVLRKQRLVKLQPVSEIHNARTDLGTLLSIVAEMFSSIPPSRSWWNSASLKPAFSTQEVPGQPGIPSKTPNRIKI